MDASTDISSRFGAIRCPECGFYHLLEDHCCVKNQNRASAPPGQDRVAILGTPPVIMAPEARAAGDGYVGGIDRDGWLALAIGMFIAALAISSSWLTYFIGLFSTMVHELGHTVAGWFFGYPSIPSFDFLYGGGITIQHDRIWMLAGIIVCLLCWYIFKFRRNIILAMMLAGGLLLYLAAALTSAHQAIILAMGHGFELIAAGMIFYRAIGSKRRLLIRSFYAFVGLFMLMDNIRFSYLIVFSSVHRHEYEAGAGVGYQMDFSRLADIYLHVDVATIALVFLLSCLITPVVSYLYMLNRERVRTVASGIVHRHS